MLGDEKYLVGAKIIKTSIRTHLTDLNNTSYPYFWGVAFALGKVKLCHNIYGESMAPGWPFKVFDIKETLFKNYFKQQIEVINKPDVFFPSLYFALMYSYEILDKYPDDIIAKEIKNKLSFKNLINYLKLRDGYNKIGFIPERITINNFCFKKGAEPLGWSLSFGVMLGLYESGFRINNIQAYDLPYLSKEEWNDFINTIITNTHQNLMDIFTVFSPATIVVENDKGEKIGVNRDTIFLREIQSGYILANEVGYPMVVTIPKENCEKLYLYGHGNGEFSLKIKKAIIGDIFMEIDYIGYITDKTIGEINLCDNVHNFDLYLDYNNDKIYDDTLKPYKIFTGVFDEKNKSKFSLKVYPNPVFENFKISYYLKEPSFVSISIKNILGKEVLNYHYIGNIGEQLFDIDASSLSTGIYFCTLKVGNEIETVKVLVIK